MKKAATRLLCRSKGAFAARGTTNQAKASDEQSPSRGLRHSGERKLTVDNVELGARQRGCIPKNGRAALGEGNKKRIKQRILPKREGINVGGVPGLTKLRPNPNWEI